jgi:hypothetical protein
MDLDCHKCNDGIKLINGCYEEVPSTNFEFEGEMLKRCPLKLVSNTSKRFLRFYQFMEKGFLPNPGGILDQPNRFLEAMSILNDTVAKVQEEERKESEVRNSHLRSGR